MDTGLIRDSFRVLAPRAEELVSFFYADLFDRGGEDVIAMFPPGMTVQRDRLLRALAEIVGKVDDTEALTGYVTALGRDHRMFGVQPGHFSMVGESLLAALEHTAGDAWTAELAGTWAEAYGIVAAAMQQGIADAEAEGEPPWREAVVISRERYGIDVVVIRARLEQPLVWLPGQSVAVQFSGLPRVRRYYSPANPPAPSGVVEFHVKIADGGQMSTALALHADPGTHLRFSAPVGTLRLDRGSPRDIVMIAGGTGLAPLLAITGELAAAEHQPDVRLYFGARDLDGLYAADLLGKLAAQHDWLHVTTAVTASPGDGTGYAGRYGQVTDVAISDDSWEGRDAYICGPAAMMRSAAARLARTGMPASAIHVEELGWES